MSARACPNCHKKHKRCLHNNRTAITPIRQKRGTNCHYCKKAKVKCPSNPGGSCPRCERLGYDCRPQDTKVKAKTSNRASRTRKTHTRALRKSVRGTTAAQHQQEGLLLSAKEDSAALEQPGDVFPSQDFITPELEYLISESCSQRQ
ncbi:hypothetical protein BC937DRAFT_93027 [Endogone sp. FLAS-F59071]|nr:hypothetical protein BC937DRAFT_93027 [Endogone sp. FLAS-F59071]|eukprot:RUS21322.1 hypothetical protein BC937DRAFT_93027 [Endogone sp. FLAS-F59071]